MSFTVDATSLGASTNPPTKSAANMNSARSPNLRFTKNISATTAAIPTYRLRAHPPSRCETFSPTFSPSPAAHAGAISTSDHATTAAPNTHLRTSTTNLRVEVRDQPPAVAIDQMQPVAEAERRPARRRVTHPRHRQHVTRVTGARGELPHRPQLHQLLRPAQRSHARARGRVVRQLLRITGQKGLQIPAHHIDDRVTLGARQRIDRRRLRRSPRRRRRERGQVVHHQTTL